MRGLLLFAVGLVAACGCGERITDDPDATDMVGDSNDESESTCEDYVGLATLEEIASTPREDPESEYLALMLTDGIVAEQGAYDRIRSDIAFMRADVPGVAHIEPYHMHDGMTLFVYPDEDTLAEIIDGSYNAWDCPNSLYQVDPSTITRDCCVLEFKGYYDIHKLAEVYGTLPGLYAHGQVQVGDGNAICVNQMGDTYHYIFDEGSGDCPAGCTIHDYFHFTSEPGSDPVLVDVIHVDHDDPIPTWVIDHCYS